MTSFLLQWLRSGAGGNRTAPTRGRNLARRPADARRSFVPHRDGLEDRILLHAYTVTRLGDRGDGSLRQAMVDANAHGGGNQMTFDPHLPGTIVRGGRKKNAQDYTFPKHHERGAAMKHLFCGLLALALFCGLAGQAKAQRKLHYVFLPLNVPGAALTGASGINESGQIVGFSENASFTTGQGFLFDKGIYTTLDVPGAAYTSLSGINDSGHIVGSYITACAFLHRARVPARQGHLHHARRARRNRWYICQRDQRLGPNRGILR